MEALAAVEIREAFIHGISVGFALALVVIGLVSFIRRSEP